MKRFALCFSLVLVSLQFASAAQNSIYGLASEGYFTEYNLDSGTKTALRNDIFVSSDNNSTYDPINQRFFVNTYNTLLAIDAQTNSKTSFGSVFGSHVSIEYDPEWNCLFGLAFGGNFIKYDLNTNSNTILRNDMFVSEDNHSTFDAINHRFFVNTYNNLTVIDLTTNTKTSLGSVFGGYASIEYDPEWDCLFGLAFGGTFTRYDLSSNTKTVLRNDVFVSSDNNSTYDPFNHIFYVNTYDSFVTLAILAGTKQSQYNLLEET